MQTIRACGASALLQNGMTWAKYGQYKIVSMGHVLLKTS